MNLQRTDDSHESGTTVAFRLPMDQLAYLREQAKQTESTVSGQIRLLIRRAMEQERRAA